MVHQEACLHLQRTLAAIRALGARPGVALNPATPLETLNYVLEDIDLLLIDDRQPRLCGAEDGAGDAAQDRGCSAA